MLKDSIENQIKLVKNNQNQHKLTCQTRRGEQDHSIESKSTKND